MTGTDDTKRVLLDLGDLVGDLATNVGTLASNVSDQTSEMRMVATNTLAQTEAMRAEARRKTKTIRYMGVILVLLSIVVGVTSFNATINRRNGDLLVDCVTPGDREPTADDHRTGNDCWDRLHDPNQSSDVVRRLTCLELVIAGYRPVGEPLDCSDIAAYIDALGEPGP